MSLSKRIEQLERGNGEIAFVWLGVNRVTDAEFDALADQKRRELGLSSDATVIGLTWRDPH